jgi:FtsZ-interacting cell division protein ZipA
MEAIIETLTLATILLIIGSVCLVIGIAGMMWVARRDRQRGEKSSDLAENLQHHEATPEKSFNS